MKIVHTLLIALVIALHLYFLWLEMFAWTTRGRKVFKKLPSEVFVPTKKMAANQGLYNGFLSAGLIWSFFIQDALWKSNVQLFFLTCVAVAGIFGALTVERKIFFVQALPALLAIALTFIIS